MGTSLPSDGDSEEDMECVIAGHTMDAWSTINKLLQADVSSKDLIMLQSFLSLFMVSFFAGSCVDTTEEYSDGEIMNYVHTIL